MILMLRSLAVACSHRSRGSLAVNETGVLPLRVWPDDLDLYGHMNNGRYFSVADLGRFDWWLRTGTLQAGRGEGWLPLVGDATCKFSRSLEPFERYQLHSRLLGWDGKWLYHEHRYLRGERVCATVVARYVLRKRSGGPQLAPTDWLRLSGWDQPSPELPDWVADWAAAQDRLTARLRSDAHTTR